jgi:hypothetical protein
MSSGFLAPQPKKRTSVLKSSFLLQKRLGKNLLRYRKSNTKHALNITLLASNSTPLRQPPWQSTTLEICISSSHRRAVGTGEGRGATAPPLDFGRYRSRTFSFKRPCLTTLPLPDFQIFLRTCTARRFCIGGAVPAFGFWINKRSIPTYLSKNELNHIKFWQTCKTNVLTRH